MKKKLLIIFLSLGAGFSTYYFYKNDKTFKTSIDKFLSRFSSANTIKNDTLIIQNKKKIAHKPIVKSKPEIHIKKDLKPSPYKNLDDYAKKTPSIYENDIDKLSNYLMKPAKSDLEKVRLIFSWIAYHIKYDAQGYNTGNYGDLSPEGVLERKVAVCEGYSALFQALCENVDLEGEKISGYAKGYGYSTEKKISGTNHAWNVIKINGIWKLFDVTWASGYGTNENGKLVSHSKFDDYWFDTKPNEFIFSHLPEDSKWQLNNPLLTFDQFLELPYIYNSLFRLGFDADYILKNFLNNSLKDIVESYSPDFPVRILTAPYARTISDNNVIEFKIESEYAEDIVAINNNDWIHFTREGNLFKLSLKPEFGELVITIKYNMQGNKYSSCLKYEVGRN